MALCLSWVSMGTKRLTKRATEKVAAKMKVHVVTAVQGMSISRLPGGRIRYEGSLHSRRQRLRISLSIGLLRCLFWLSSTAGQMWHNLSGQCFGYQPLALPLVTN